MRNVGMGAKKENNQPVDYEVYMEAVKEIERLQTICAERNSENVELKAVNEELQSQNNSLVEENLAPTAKAKEK